MPHLKPNRVHEACGPGRHLFGLFQAMQVGGPVAWVRPARALEHLLPTGIPADLASQLLLITPGAKTDLLWSTEEALRAGAGLVISEPDKPLSLTAGRRLQLAAEAGRTTGLMLICDGSGSPAAETRWACEPIAGDSTRHRWDIIKNKSGTLGTWIVNWDGAQTAFDLASATSQRSGPTQTPS